MPVSPKLTVNDCIWIRSGNTDQQYIFRSIRSALIERGITVLTLNHANDTEGLEKIRRAVWHSDRHVIMDGMVPNELRRLQPVFARRKNFSMALVDWWTSPYWFTRNAEYIIVRNYNGIAIRNGQGSFVGNRRPPLISLPEQFVPYQMACLALRLPALIAAPFLEINKQRQRKAEQLPRGRMLYFPFTLAAEHVPLASATSEYDFASVSSSRGYWILRDPYASAWLNFADLYYDRSRIANLLLRATNPRCKVYDVRRAPSGRVNWDEYCKVVRQSRYAICTGGLHQNSVAKYTEFACLGTPMFGEEIPFEFPWLKDCLFPVDTLNVTPEKLGSQIREALALQPKLRENCLNHRDSLLKLYNAHRVLDLLQEQADGKRIPPGYLKPEAFDNAAAQN